MKRFLFIVLASFLGVAVGAISKKYLFRSSRPVVASTSLEAVKDPVKPTEGAKEVSQVEAIAPGKESEPPYPTGYVALRGHITVQMSDGTTRTDRDSELQHVERNSITLGGKKLFLKAKPRASAEEKTEGKSVLSAALTARVEPPVRVDRPGFRLLQ